MGNNVPGTRVEQDTVRGHYRLALAASSGQASFLSARGPQADAPETTARSGVFDAQRNLMSLVPFGEGADNATVSVRVIGWSRIVDANGKGIGWMPVHICTVQATLSTSINGAAVVTPGSTDDHFPDTITLVDGDSGAVTIKNGVADGSGASVLIDTLGYEKIEIEPIDDGSATAANAYFRAL